MPDTHDHGRFYWHMQRYPDLSEFEMPVKMPRFTEAAATYMVEEPFCTGKGRAFRLWPTRWAIVIGIWYPAVSYESEALLNATAGRNLPTKLEEIKQWPGAPAEDIPEEFADSIGVISYVEPEAASQ